ncbi:MAG TPA: hypothetical protein VEK13_07835, partial [Thermoplasmata archaeon]|nr:hypothetical protein [Thermoplasmata archaeon]
MATTAPAGASSPRIARVPLASLPPELARLLSYASAIGSEFPFELLRTATGADEEALAENLERLIDLGVLRERPGGGRFAFVDEETR